MDDEAVLNDLKGFSDEHRLILYWHLKGETAAEIGRRISSSHKRSTTGYLSKETIGLRLNEIRVALQDRDLANTRHADVLLLLADRGEGFEPELDPEKWNLTKLQLSIDDSEAESEEQPEEDARPEQDEDEFVGDSGAAEGSIGTDDGSNGRGEGLDTEESEPTPQPFLVRLVLVLAAIASIAIMLGIAVFLFLVITDRLPERVVFADTPDVPAMQTEAAITALTAVAERPADLEPTPDETATMAGLITQAVKEVVGPTPSDTSTVTPPPTNSATPTETSTPTDTATPAPTPTPWVDTLEDYFTDGLGDMWFVSRGNYEIINNQLSAPRSVFVTTGDEGWSSYVVELATGEINGRSGGEPINYIAVSINDDYMVAFELVHGNDWGHVWIFQNGSWREIDTFRYGGTTTMENKEMRIEVDEGNLRAFLNSNEIASYHTPVDSGKFGIRLNEGSTIDWVVISPN